MDRRSKLVILTSNLMRSIRTMETLILGMSVFLRLVFCVRFLYIRFFCVWFFYVLISITGFFGGD